MPGDTGARIEVQFCTVSLIPVWLAIHVPAMRESGLLELRMQPDIPANSTMAGLAGEHTEAVNLSMVKLEGAHEPVT